MTTNGVMLFTISEPGQTNFPNLYEFAEFFHEASRNASAIHFNLSGIEGIEHGVPNLGRGVLESSTGLVTMGELSAVLRDPKLLGKAVFYNNGARTAAPKLLP